MNRKQTLLLGAVVAVAIFAVMALAIRATVPWTVQADDVATQADDATAQLQAAAADLDAGKAVDGAALAAAGSDLRAAANDLVVAATTWSADAALRNATRDLDARLETFNATLAQLEPAAPTAGDVHGLAIAAANLATSAHAVDAAAAALPEKANDQAALADRLFGPQVIALEVLGILLTAAMIGALVIARPLDAAADDSHYSHPTPEQVAESDRASDVATHTGANK